MAHTDARLRGPFSEDMEHLNWRDRKLRLERCLVAVAALLAPLLLPLLLVGSVCLLPLNGDDCPLNSHGAPVLSDDSLPPLPELRLGCALDVLAAPSCPALSCGPGTVEDPITSKCEISCDEVGRRLSAAEKEKLGERPLALAPREYLEGYLADHPGFAAVVDDELHELLLEVLSDGMALARPNALAELP